MFVKLTSSDVHAVAIDTRISHVSAIIYPVLMNGGKLERGLVSDQSLARPERDRRAESADFSLCRSVSPKEGICHTAANSAELMPVNSMHLCKVLYTL